MRSTRKQYLVLLAVLIASLAIWARLIPPLESEPQPQGLSPFLKESLHAHRLRYGVRSRERRCTSLSFTRANSPLNSSICFSCWLTSDRNFSPSSRSARTNRVLGRPGAFRKASRHLLE